MELYVNQARHFVPQNAITSRIVVARRGASSPCNLHGRNLIGLNDNNHSHEIEPKQMQPAGRQVRSDG